MINQHLSYSLSKIKSKDCKLYLFHYVNFLFLCPFAKLAFFLEKKLGFHGIQAYYADTNQDGRKTSGYSYLPLHYTTTNNTNSSKGEEYIAPKLTSPSKVH